MSVMTGLELKIQRVTADVRSKDIAQEMGVDPSRITKIESSRKVTPETQERYLAALATCTTKSTRVA
jgi:predicted transcriptional regulator